MSLTKAKVLLDKINTLYRSMSLDPGNINAIERDLMMSYIRQLYESFLLSDAAPAKAEDKPAARIEVPKVEKRSEIPVMKTAESVAAPVESPPTKEDKSIVVEFMPKPPPRHHPAPAKAPPAAVEPAPEQPVEETAQEKQIETTETIAPVFQPAVMEKPIHASSDDPKITALFSNEKATDLSTRLGEASIPDIRKSMGINDRLLAVKELFGGDQAVFDEALAALNQMTHFDEAQRYMTDRLVHRFRWTAEERKSAARDFIKLVRRRYKQV